MDKPKWDKYKVLRSLRRGPGESSGSDKKSPPKEDETLAPPPADKFPNEGLKVDGSGDVLELFDLDSEKDEVLFEPEGYQYLAACGPTAPSNNPSVRAYLVPPNKPYGEPERSFDVTIGPGNGAFVTREFLQLVDCEECRSIAFLDWRQEPSQTKFLPGVGRLEVFGKAVIQFLLPIEDTGGFLEVRCHAWVTPNVLDYVSGAAVWIGENVVPAYKKVASFHWAKDGLSASPQLLLKWNSDDGRVTKIKLR